MNQIEFCLAYIDPGAGSLIVQMLASTVVGAAVLLRQKLFSIFPKKTPAKPQAEGEVGPKSATIDESID